jgi:hypothetical protein
MWIRIRNATLLAGILSFFIFQFIYEQHLLFRLLLQLEYWNLHYFSIVAGHVANIHRLSFLFRDPNSDPLQLPVPYLYRTGTSIM